MTHIHLAVKDGQLIGQPVGDLSEGTFYVLDGKYFRVLLSADESKYVTSLNMSELEVVYHQMSEKVRPVIMKKINIEVEVE